MFRSIGWQELLLILVIILLILGPKKLPEMARSLGSALREFRSEQRGGKTDHAERTEGGQGASNPDER